MTNPRLFLAAFAAIFAGLSAAPVALAAGEGTVFENSHREYVTQYEGTKTCIACHETEARAAHASIHYQWKARAPNLVNAGDKALGKINTLNDFCTNPGISWIARVQNADGKVIAKGCSACHAGLGAKPEVEPTTAQLENVDCLMCHFPAYRRDLVDVEGGKLKWAPARSCPTAPRACGATPGPAAAPITSAATSRPPRSRAAPSTSTSDRR
jgi:hypothetical protein